MKVYVPEFVPANIRRRFFIVVAYILCMLSMGLIEIDLKDDEGFEYTVS